MFSRDLTGSRNPVKNRSAGANTMTQEEMEENTMQGGCEARRRGGEEGGWSDI